MRESQLRCSACNSSVLGILPKLRFQGPRTTRTHGTEATGPGYSCDGPDAAHWPAGSPPEQRGPMTPQRQSHPPWALRPPAPQACLPVSSPTVWPFSKLDDSRVEALTFLSRRRQNAQAKKKKKKVSFLKVNFFSIYSFFFFPEKTPPSLQWRCGNLHMAPKEIKSEENVKLETKGSELVQKHLCCPSLKIHT